MRPPSTVDRTWLYLDGLPGLHQRMIKKNRARRLLPAARPAKARPSLTIEQAQRPLLDAIPATSARPSRSPASCADSAPVKLAGLRRPFASRVAGARPLPGKLVALRTRLKARRSTPSLAKEGVIPQLQKLWGSAGTRQLNSLKLADAYHIRLTRCRN